ncbi:hypothetical protein DB347_13775 [Opitutaceae bacterium EW11]|nr:hypothetical protein DB347_13775 [Opitutaceae bacterium EW11]
MKISCLIAAYKAGATIGKALESIRGQTHADWEVVVMEDGSHDGTEAIVRAFASSVSQPVRYENFGQNRGVAAARTRLLELAEGVGSAFLDADDWWTPDHLSEAAAALGRGADLVVSGIQLFDLDSAEALEAYLPSGDLYTDPVRILFEQSAIMTSSCVSLRTATAREAGPVDAGFRIGEDRDFWLRIAANGGRFAGTGKVTCSYSKHAGSTMAKTLLWAEQEVAFYRKYQSLSAVALSVRRTHLAHALANYGRLLRATDPRTSARILAEAWKLKPLSPAAAAQYALSALKSAR